ncbi:C40 family peptidase [Azovibrio restrictus]|uniref:C40 family peptidase n=1 Tax=Azovibrio restrictus TaxID=146938 RepID=UPI0026EEDFE7|nr:C40 family peptidase [Azovibrio restrictus]
MSKLRKAFLLALLLASAGGYSLAGHAEPARKAEEPSFFERYSNAAQDVILKGLELVGINYRMGGNDPNSGLDCSSYVQTVYRDAIGLVLPRTAKEQSLLGEEVDRSELKPGDLVFFNTMRRAFSHVGIYLGDNYFLHAPRAGSAVRVESMQSSYWVQRYNGARRVID